jgi:isoquinoline 1-oxidoreductase
MSACRHSDPFAPERYELGEAPRYAFDVDRRDFIKSLGGGIAVLLVLPARAPGAELPWAEAQDRDGGIGAFLHIDAKGAITVYTGKAEVGQDIRTSLTQAVADELAVPCSGIALVMADTDRVPHDAGTFGSRTTPAMAPQLRRAAAAAREVLLDLAAEKLGAERGALSVAEGAVRHAATGRAATFGELTEGKALTQRIAADARPQAAAQWTAAGRSVPKVNGRDLVTGAHRFPSDVARPGMLHGAVLRPPAFGAKLRALDDAAAKRVAGATVVRDGDFAGVVARDAHTARKALAALHATWDAPAGPDPAELEAILRRPASGGREGRGGRGPRGGGERGDVAAGLAAAAHRLEATYTVPYIAHAPLEPRAAVAEWSEDGKLTVWTGTQRPFGVRDELMRAFRLAADKVRVIVPDTGSGYGGKHTGDAAVEAASLARAVGLPVAVRWSREEEFTWAYFRPAGVIDVRAGADASGKLVAWECHNYNSGASSLSPPYEVGNVRCQFHAADSPLRQGSYRALAATANCFARESHVDDLAAAVGHDPLAFRRANLGEPRLLAVLDAAAARAGWGGELPAGVGRGIACGVEKGGYVASVADVEVDGTSFTVRRVVTAFECGAVVHPDNLQSQVEGAVVQGLGGALFEAIAFRGGRIENPRFSQYRVPRFRDVPVLETVLLDRKDLPSAGAGETPIVGVAPAVRNALAAATGKRLRSLPLRLA